MKGKAAAKKECGKEICSGDTCTSISVHIKCDKTVKSAVILGKAESKKYCDKTFVFDCERDKWTRP